MNNPVVILDRNVAAVIEVRGNSFLITPSPSVAVTASAPATFPELDD